MSSRALILERIRAALAVPSAYPLQELSAETPIYAEAEEQDLVLQFADVFKSRNGQFFYVAEPAHFYGMVADFIAERKLSHIFCWEDSLVEWLQQAGIAVEKTDANLAACDASFTFCEVLAARTGSIFVSSAQGAGRRLTIYPPVHIVVGFVSQILPDIGQALAWLRQLYPDRLPSMISMITGPSRTADIEKTLVMGAHGPKELVLFLIDDTV